MNKSQMSNILVAHDHGKIIDTYIILEKLAFLKKLG